MAALQRNKMAPVGTFAVKQFQAICGLPSGARSCEGRVRACFPPRSFPSLRRVRLIMSLGRFYSSGVEPKSCMWFSNTYFITHSTITSIMCG